MVVAPIVTPIPPTSWIELTRSGVQRVSPYCRAIMSYGCPHSDGWGGLSASKTVADCPDLRIERAGLT